MKAVVPSPDMTCGHDRLNGKVFWWFVATCEVVMIASRGSAREYM